MGALEIRNNAIQKVAACVIAAALDFLDNQFATGPYKRFDNGFVGRGKTEQELTTNEFYIVGELVRKAIDINVDVTPNNYFGYDWKINGQYSG